MNFNRRFHFLAYIMVFLKIMPICTVFCIFFPGCDKNPAQSSSEAKPVFDFCCDAQVKIDDYKILCEFQRLQQGLVTITIKEPELIKGMQFCWSGDHMKTKFGTLSFEARNGSLLPLESFACATTQILEHASKIQSCSENIKGTFNGHKYLITFDQSIGQIQRLYVDSLKLEVIFQRPSPSLALDSVYRKNLL